MSQLCSKFERSSDSKDAPLCGKFIDSGIFDQRVMDFKLQEIYSNDAALKLIDSILG